MANQLFDFFLRRINSLGSSTQDRAQDTVRTHMLWSMGAGLVPVPVIDIAAVTAVQLDMIHNLCRIYGVEYSESIVKQLISALAGSTFARLGASFVKAIPVVGTFLGGVSMAALSAASTFAIGQVFIQHFERNGTLRDFDINAYRRSFDENFQFGKKVAKEMEHEQRDTSADAFAKLERLNTMKDRGIISEEEFQQKKDEILREI